MNLYTENPCFSYQTRDRKKLTRGKDHNWKGDAIDFRGREEQSMQASGVKKKAHDYTNLHARTNGRPAAQNQQRKIPGIIIS